MQSQEKDKNGAAAVGSRKNSVRSNGKANKENYVKPFNLGIIQAPQISSHRQLPNPRNLKLMTEQEHAMTENSDGQNFKKGPVHHTIDYENARVPQFVADMMLRKQ